MPLTHLRVTDTSFALVTFWHDSTLIASGVGDNMIRIWNTSTGECVQTLDIELPALYIGFRCGDSRACRPTVVLVLR